MDPISAVGIALSVAGLAGQLFTGCIQCIQFILTAKEMPKDCQYLNLRLRMEQQRLFAWSETSGLLDYDAENNQKVLESNAFGLHRSTVLELLVQIKVLFEDFEKQQRRHKLLETIAHRDQRRPPPYQKSDPGEEAFDLVPLAPKRRGFIEKAIKSWENSSKERFNRLRWASFDKNQFEQLLQRFSFLNDSITSLLDMRLQDEIYCTTQDTNRGVLQLHHDLADLQQLVKATLVLTLENKTIKRTDTGLQMRGTENENIMGLELLAQLARFKAFNESIEMEIPLDKATAEVLQLGNPGAEKSAMEIDRSCISIPDIASGGKQGSRCEAIYMQNGVVRRVWIEWKEYDEESPENPHPAPLVIERAQKLAALLHRRPKPKYFCVPHCLGYFDDAEHVSSPQGDKSPASDDGENRIGFVFDKPEEVAPETPPVSLLELLRLEGKPRVTDRIAIAKAVANCILYLHSVNWLHKGLRSSNIVFFRTDTNQIDYEKPYISGFDFARPARPGEPTEIPVNSAEYNLYRHPRTQNVLGEWETYRKSFDIYSLGVILVELAHWQTIDEVLEIDLTRANTRPKVAAGVRESLLKEQRLRAIGAHMGTVYEKLVQKCITGGQQLGIGDGKDETQDLQVAARLSMVFYEDVVRKLEEIRV